MRPESRSRNGPAGRGRPSDSPAKAAVAARPAHAKGRAIRRKPRGNSLSRLLLKYAGCCTGLPSDLAAEHDHYLYGTPKRRKSQEKAMTYKGRVRNGAVVLDKPSDLPEGAEVEVHLVPSKADGAESNPLRELHRKYSGALKGLPRDLARNHDHYAHGAPKR